MSKRLLRWLAPVVILGGAYGAFNVIASSGPEAEEKKEGGTLPLVQAENLFPIDYQVIISSFGEISPVEKTRLSAQVSGEVTNWHPNFVAGGIVKRGEVLFQLEQDNYEAAVLQAEASLASAKASLIEEQAKAKVAEKQAKKLNNKQVTDLYLRKPQVLSAQAQVKSAQAGLKRAKRDLENCTVIAPYDALVVSRNIGVGQFVTAGSEVAQLNNIEAAEVRIPIAGFDSAFLPDTLRGIKATIIEKGGRAIEREGFIARDLGVVDSNTRMVNLVVQIEDPYGINSGKPTLKFGSYVQVSFAGKELKHIYRLPQELVNNHTVWIVNEENQLEPRTVNVLREEGEFFLIGDGIEEKDQVVLTLPEYPQRGMNVEIAQSGSESANVAK
ncbi:efflux RND transporter periplasmic adaptor subunit [Vibrio sp. S9_S30]|uniref:efflux RND transporter periplasmic adaptor subunit n=1 Tax=Vibrio sp. S9_S30 TaxID=2720226 RepID=UPI001680BE46|nr:efflux RND transporter periplasmic adaptor subunit [Vibrio sp. S9_S30]MBD1557229.1 efflux RND transporter periplasmic adaptor subunit [Vibrio sp. S9_S30]